jgi:lipoprotein-anchoring transpeptidase ErfK/SrfK
MQTKRPTLALATVAGVVLLATTLVGCGNLPGKAPAGQASEQPTSAASTAKAGESGDDPTEAAPTEAPSVALKPSVEEGAKDVKVSTVVSVKAEAGTVTSVKLWTKGKDDDGDTRTIEVDGTISEDGSTWTADEALDPASKYRLEMTGKNASDQATVESKSSFTTTELSLAEQTYPSIQPAKGSTVGVGMPVILTFDVAVKDRKEFEKHLSVTSTPSQEGSWNWYNSKTVHFRPKEYWKTGTKVKVEANLNGVEAGNGVYGQKSISTSFKVGRSLITKIDLKNHVAKVYKNGKKVRTIYVSAGKPGWQTRSGTKLIMAKEYNKVMTNEAIGALEDYRLTAKYALRITNSGEFIHSAPWNAAHFGRRNASHGCVGMTNADAGWLYEQSRPGDPVVTTGTSRTLEQGNGWSDWDISYKEYKKGSAL